MKKRLGMFTLGALLSFATVAYAADVTATIKSISVPNHLVTMDDGKVYTMTANVDLTKFKAGDKVKVTYVPATGVAASALGIFGSGNNMAPAT